MNPLQAKGSWPPVVAIGFLLISMPVQAGIIAQDSFSVPPYKVGTLAGQSAGGTGFSGTWTKVSGLTQDLSVNSSGVVGRPAVPSGSAGDYVNFTAPVTLSGQLFVSFTMANPSSTNLNATRIDLNFSTASPFVGSRAFFGGFGVLSNLNFDLESGLSSGGTVVTATSAIPSTGTHHLVGVLDVQNKQVALFVDPTSSSYYSATGANNATITAAWTPASSLYLSSYSLIENTNDSVTFANVVFATDAASVGLGSGSISSSANLIVNGDAESGTASGWDSPPKTIPGWTTDGNMTVVAYTDGGGDVTPTSPGPPVRGNNYFSATEVDSAQMTQLIDISSSATTIDAGTQPYTLDGWLGGFDGQDDNAVVQATFESSAGASLGTATIGPVLAADRGGVSLLLERTATGTVPAGTRKVLITVTITRASGSDDDGLADDLSFTLAGSGATGCTYVLTSSSQSAVATATTASIGVTSGTGCTWTAVSNSSWITVNSGASGSGGGTVAVQIAANTGSSRVGTVTIAGQTWTVIQAGATSGQYTEIDLSPYVNDDTRNYAGSPQYPTGENTYLTVPFNIASTSKGFNTWAGTSSATGTTTLTIQVDVSGVTSAYFLLNSIWGVAGSLSDPTTSKASITFTGAGGATYTKPLYGNIDIRDYYLNYTTTINGTTTKNIWTDGSHVLDRVEVDLPTAFAGQTLSTITLTDAGATGVQRLMLKGVTVSTGSVTTSCTYTLSTTAGVVVAAAGTETMSVTTSTGCAWTAASNTSWITVSSGASGTASGTVTYATAANTTSSSRTGTLTIAGQTLTVTQAGTTQTGCSYNVSPTDIHVTAAASSGSFLVFTNTSCAWTSVLPIGISWLTVSPGSGTGGGAAGYSIQANAGQARSTSLVVAGTMVTVEQDAASNCKYSLSSTSQEISGAGGSSATTVTVTGTSCPAWTISTPSVSWVHVTSATNQTASGLATYTVDANTTTSQRTTSLTIAGQTYSITQDVAPCTYSLSASSSSTFAAAGSTGTVQLTAGSICPWAITLPTDTGSQWVHVTSALSAAGSATISYAVDINPTTSARSLTMTVTGQRPPTQLTYKISQAAGTANTGPVPVITPGGVVNAANFISANIPAGAIAQGSFFSIFGSGLGPDTPQKASSYPLGTTLGGVSIKVTQGTTSVAAIPVFVAPFQVNAVMPSNAPTGTVQVVVSYNGFTSAPVATQVAVTNFSIFAVSGGRGPGIIQNYVSATQLPLNTATTTAAPGDVVILWGTGLGPLPNGASDTLPPSAGSLPVTVQVNVGTIAVTPLYSGRAPGLAGVDQINFVIPQNAPLGCFVPIQITAAGLASNTVTMAIATGRQACSDANPASSLPQTGGNQGTVVLSRLTFTDAANTADTGVVDVGAAVFVNQTAGGSLGFGLFTSAPPPNTCTYYNNVNSLNSVLVGQLPSDLGAGTNLDAGASISIVGPNGVRSITYSDASTATSPYVGLLGAGGVIASLGLTADPLFLDPGSYTVTGTGGSGVGPFSIPMTVSTGATWTNRDQIAVINRSSGLTINWSGGDSTKQMGLILGLASNQTTNVSGLFTCLVTLDQHTFTVPASMMENLPATPGTTTGGVQSGLLFLTLPSGSQIVDFKTTAAPALDTGLALFLSGDLRSNVTFK